MKHRRNTTATAEILNLLSQSKTALSHANIQQSLDGLCNRVTIYRVLDRLTEDGVVHKIVNIDGVVVYAICHTCTSKEHHHNHLHFSCEKCHAVTCLDNIEPSFKLPKKYKVNHVNFTVSGICPLCC
ncbi:MAG: transcriptional repressor [Chitinophagaceae bacterium]|nr:transcriptional repressor [Chitinophagaceae bacterium]